MDSHYWHTEESHQNNMYTMLDWIDHEMPEDWEIIFIDGTYAEVQRPDGKMFEVHARGDGDFNHHAVDFVPMYDEDKADT